MKLNGAFLVGLGLLVLLVLAACQTGVERETAVIPTPSIVPTSTAVPILTSSPPTATQTPVVTLTPLPTFAPAELETAVADLLANPMNCDVPCWWGAIPGETTFFEIYQFLGLHQFNDYVQYLDQVPDDSFELRIRPEEEENAGQYGFRVMYGFNNNNVLTSLSAGSAPPISNVLEKFGQPDEVWVATGMAPETIVRINMVYLQESMAFGHAAIGDVQDDMFKGCFSDETGIVILKRSHSVTKHTDFFTLFEEDRLYLPLEETSDLTMDEFIEVFSDPTQAQCIETPIELWE